MKYKVERSVPTGGLERVLNEYAEAGWRLVSVTHIPSVAGAVTIVLSKE